MSIVAVQYNQRIPTSQRNDLSNLDALRTIAVTAVLIDHLVMLLAGRNGNLRPFAEGLGHAGVLAFFVHTSLVLMFSLQRLPDCGKTGSFYVRRIFRIYPLAVLCVVCFVLFRIPAAPMISGTFQPPSAIVVIANLFLIQSVIAHFSVCAPMWSLPFEVQMYVVLPYLHKLTLLRRARTYLTVLIIGSSLFAWTLQHLTGHYNVFGYVPCFLSGVLAYLIRHGRPFLPAGAWPFALVLWTGLLGWAMAATDIEVYLPISWLATVLLGVGIWCFHDSSSRKWNKATEMIARYSYGIYLGHIPVMWLVFYVVPIHNIVAFVLLWLTGTLAVAIAAYHLLEEPMINLGKKISARPVAEITVAANSAGDFRG